MSERAAIRKAGSRPNTVTSLVQDFEKLGLQPGMTVLVHSSMSALGWVCGGPVAVILALEQILGESGTLVMPTHTGGLSDPEFWGDPPVPETWWNIIKNEMPAFDKDLTPTRGMGVIPETFRKQVNVLRSNHPLYSFAAWGKHTEFITERNNNSLYDFSQNETSPLGRVYDLDGFVLLLGVDYSNNTSFHLAEYKAEYPGKKVIDEGCPVMENGQRTWITFKDIVLNSDDFSLIGNTYEQSHSIAESRVGQAKATLISQRSLVDYATTWMEINRL